MVDGFRVTEEEGFALVAIAARRDVDPASIGACLSLDMPAARRWTAGPAMAMIATAPGMWLAYRGEPAPGWPGELAQRLAGLAGVTDQGGAYRLFRIEGAKARTLLQRGAAIDLDGRVFPAGTVAITMIAHIDVVIRRLDGGDTCQLAVYRSYGGSFLRWLDNAMAGL